MSYVFSARHCPTAGAKVTKPIIFVIGADGLLGKATVNALSLMYGRMFDIKAGVETPARFTGFESKTGVSVVQTDMDKQEKLVETFRAASRLCIISPTREDRAQLTINTVMAAKEAGVQHVLVYSIVTADLTDTIFGKQFKEVERAVSKLDVPYTFLRLPLYMDNYLAYEATIKNKYVFYGAVDPNMLYTPVAADDAASTAAAILVSPEKHAGKTYTIVSDRHTFADLAEAFTKALSHKIEYVRVPYEEAKASFVQRHKFPEWQAEGIMEMYRLVDAASPVTNQENVNEFTEITGKKPTTLSTWVMRYASGFK